ncbi:hypothetical protein FS837_004908 [Tulasnella sp. UAMH 9824]|nr:hypothetical protein FS837_004908 [Tulasnella sp. UAMH 9824]
MPKPIPANGGRAAGFEGCLNTHLLHNMETQASSPPDSISSPIPKAEVSQLAFDDRLLEIGQESVRLESLFLQLPPHVVVRISDHLDITEKISLLVTCQHFRQVLEPIVYQHLRPGGDWKTWRRLRLFKTLQERGHLLPYIHSFCGLLIPTRSARPHEPSEEVRSTKYSREELIQNEWFAIAAPLYAQAINIRDLEFTDYMGWKQDDSWEVFKNMVSNMKLDKLAFGSCSGALLDFTPVLRGQPELTKLELRCFEARFDGLEDTAVPNLNFFNGTLKQAATIVPGRPVEKLEAMCPCVVGCQCLDEDVYRKLSQSSKVIYILKLQPHSGFKEETLRGMLQLVALYLPKILELTIHAETCLEAQMLLEEIPNFGSLRSLTLLRALLLFPDPPPTCTWLPQCLRPNIQKVENFRDFADKLNDLRSSLTNVRSILRESVYLPSGSNLEDYI